MRTESAARASSHPRDAQLAAWKRASAIMPGGTNSNFRAWGEDRLRRPRARAAASGTSTATSTSTCGWATARSSWATRDDRVDDYVNERMRAGVSFSLTSEDEVRVDGAHLRAHRLGRHGPHDRLGHRGDDARDAHRAGVHGPHQDREVRGPVPRRPRLRPDQRPARTTSPTSATSDNPVGLAWGRGHPGRRRRHDHPGPLQQHRAPCARSSSARATRSPAIIVEPVLGNAQGILPQAGLPPGDAGADRGVRDPPDLRRGEDRLPASPGAGPPSSSASRRTSPPTPRRWATATRPPRSAARREIMAVLPKKVSHGGTYAGQPGRRRGRGRDALEILRDTAALEGDRGDRPGDPGGPRVDHRRDGPALPLHRSPVDVRDHVHRGDPGEYRDWANTDHEPSTTRSRSACRPAGRCPSRISREPWFVCEAHDAADVATGRLEASRARSTRPSRRGRMAAETTRSPGAGPGLRAGLAPVPGPADGKVRAARGRTAVAAGRPADRREPAGRPTNGGAVPPAVSTEASRGTAALPAPGDAEEREFDGNAVRSVDRAAALLLALGELPGGGRRHASSPAGSGSTRAPLRACWPRSSGAAWWSRTRRPGSTAWGSSSSGSPSAPRRRSTCGASRCRSSNASPGQTKETVSLCVREGDGCLTVAQVDGPNMVACADWTGRSTPLHCVAAGKVLLSAMAEREVLRLARGGLARLAERTITELRALLEELARVRRRGYATAFSEWEAGVNAVAAPVHDARGQVMAAVDVWGPVVPDHAAAGW